MAGELVREGAIPPDGVLELLRSIETARTSGVLRFEIDGSWREVALVAGQLALDQAASDGADPVEALLQARSGRFEILQRLPPLAVSKGDTRVRTGSLAVHVPVDLMTYCEGAGLTGVLEFVRDDERAEAVYDKGELTAIQFGGRAGGDVNEVFAWETGTFKIEALPVVPELDVELLPPSVPPPPMPVSAEPALPSAPAPRRDETVPISRKARRRRDETGQNFLKVIETTLGAIVDNAEKGRSPTRTSPPLTPAPAPRPESLPPARPSRESTVRIIYLTGDASPLVKDAPGVGSTRHVQARVAGEGVLPKASPERTRVTPKSAETSAEGERVALPASIVGLAFGGLALALGVLAAAAALLLAAR